jgi:hypothetical protein
MKTWQTSFIFGKRSRKQVCYFYLSS